METKKIECVTGRKYEAIELKNSRDLPKSAFVFECGQEYNKGVFGRSFTIYKKFAKKGTKTYVVFSKYF